MATANVFKLEVCVDGASFNEAGWGDEVARILQEQAPKIREGQTFGRIKDANGNRVGFFHYDTEERADA